MKADKLSWVSSADIILSFPSKDSPKPPWRSHDSLAHAHILDSQARSRIVALHFDFVLGILQFVQLLIMVNLLRDSFDVPGCPEPSVERCTHWEIFNAFEYDSYMVTAVEILKDVRFLREMNRTRSGLR